MSTVRKTISVTSQQDAWIKSQIAQGGFASDSEVIRELIRNEQARDAGNKTGDLTEKKVVEFMKKHDATIQRLAR